MKKINNLLIKKTVLITWSTMMVALGVSLFLESSLGSDPVSVLVDGLRRNLHIPMGDASLAYNLVVLALALLFARRFVQFGTVINAVGIGLMMNLIAPRLLQMAGESPSLGVRVAMLLAGQVILCFGVALNLSTKFGFGVGDALLVRLSEQFRLKYKNLKILSDLTHTIAGVLLGGVFGVGSLVAVLTGGPLISFFMKYGAKNLVNLFKIPQ